MQLTFKGISRESQFRTLVDSVKYCNLCPRMQNRTKVLSFDNGNIHSKVLFIAEAPGRLGADRTAIPLYGDKAGDNFNLLLSNIGWQRDDIFITNAVICNPRQDNGNNATPTSEEISNCSYFLEMTLNIINPEVIVTLGATALAALGLLQPNPYTLKNTAGKIVNWAGRKLFVAYHPSQRAAVHRSMARQRADFYRLSKYVHPMNGIRDRHKRVVKSTESARERLLAMLDSISLVVSHVGKISKFKLVKLLYLADLAATERLGRTITGSAYLRQVEGPWPPAIDKALNILKGFEIELGYYKRMPVVMQGPNPKTLNNLTNDEISILIEIIEKYGLLNNAKIKTLTYQTPPMKSILKRERLGENLLNKIVLNPSQEEL